LPLLSGDKLRNIVAAARFAASTPLDLDRLAALFDDNERPSKATLRSVLDELRQHYQGHGVELVEVASGCRFQVPNGLAPWISRLWEQRPPRYSRALLETLALIAYRQPITRAEIEEVRGVAVSTNIIRTLEERQWIRALGHRDVPGRPTLYGTTRQFLDYFNLKSLNELPTLAEIRDLDEVAREFEKTLEDTENNKPSGNDDAA
jgi:segregation and condensation protein B